MKGQNQLEAFGLFNPLGTDIKMIQEEHGELNTFP
jgi:hypothetical protein